MSDKYRDIENMLNGLFPEAQNLRDLFNKRLYELDMSVTSACTNLGIQSRAMQGILDGTQKIIDSTNILTLSNFLQVSDEEVWKLYITALRKNFQSSAIPLEKIEFIKENFNLAVLKKAGLINSVTDFAHIDRKLTQRLGLKSILEYRKPSTDVAFSSGLFNPDNDIVRENWIEFAKACFREIDNPYTYQRDELIKMFAKMRWYSLDVERGISEVIRLLYKVGVTVVVQSPLQNLKLRGAIFNVNGKPCVVLTNYAGFYATLWFALIHELYHVLFDWDEIKASRYHLTDDSNEELSVREREQEADNFAREYLLPKEKSLLVRSYINNAAYVREFAADNQIHPSLVYVFNAFDTGSGDRTVWARAKKFSPPVTNATKDIEISWQDERTVEEIMSSLKPNLYV